MDLISKTILEEEEWTDLYLWNIQDCKRYARKKKIKITKLIYTLLKIMGKVIPKFKGKIIKGLMQFDRKEDYLNYVQSLEGFENYLSKVRQWASQELNVYVPEPNECDYD